MYNRSLALGLSKQLEINIINIRHEIRSIICVFKPFRKRVLCVYHRETNFRKFYKIKLIDIILYHNPPIFCWWSKNIRTAFY